MKKLISIILITCSQFVHAQILFESDFSNGDKTQGGNLSIGQIGTQPHSCNIVDSIGKPAARMEVRPTDPELSLSFRSEYQLPQSLPFMKNVRYHGIEITQPYWQGPDPKAECNFQIVDSSSRWVYFEIIHINNNYKVYQHYNYTGDTTYSRSWDLDVADTPGVPNFFVTDFKPSIDNDGYIKLYRNGVPVKFTNCKDEFGHDVDAPDTYVINGPNASTLTTGPGRKMISSWYDKTGEYKYTYKGTDPSTFPKRVVYISKIKLAGEASTINDFTPTAQPKPTPDPSGAVWLPWIIIN